MSLIVSTPDTLDGLLAEYPTLTREGVAAVAFRLVYAYSQGWELTYGEAWRSPEEAKRQASVGGGISNSLHTKRLARGVNLFRRGLRAAWRLLEKSESAVPLGR